MKKRILTALTAALFVCGLAACADNNIADPSVSSLPDGPAEKTASPQSEPTEASDDSPENVMTEKERYVYGEDKLPDIPCGDVGSEGKANVQRDSERLQQCLNSMVFETHTLGDYTINLVGDSVRTDEANFPGSIYTQRLRVEVEKDGVKLEGDGSYNDTVLYAPELWTEYRLFSDKIGNYLDVYDMEYPVITMRYYFEESPKRLVKNAVEFATIQDGRLWGGIEGIFGKGAGVIRNPNADTSGTETLLTVNSERGEKCRAGIYDGGEFNVLDKTTLGDEETGIWYYFQFSDPPQAEAYAAEVVHSKTLYQTQNGESVKKIEGCRLTSSEWEQLKPIFDWAYWMQWDKDSEKVVNDIDPGVIAEVMVNVFGELEKGEYECVVCHVDQLSSIDFTIE